MNLNKINLTEKLSLINEHWRPKVVGELNGQEVKLVKFKGEFVWHHHEKEDELFLCINGSMTVEFREQKVILHPGEFVIVPHGVEHRTLAEEEAHVLIFEPAATKNTGNVDDALFTAPNNVKI
ncbi:MAG: cupin domain-containing protein [Ignavibacteriales bacterium]|nr:cupin domain-containing protein [Ignavibacteriales bacterium]